MFFFLLPKPAVILLTVCSGRAHENSLRSKETHVSSIIIFHQQTYHSTQTKTPTNTLLTSLKPFHVKMNPNKHRLIFSVISHATADPDFPVGISVWRLLCEFIVFVQQFESGAEFYFMVAGQMKGFPPLGLDKQ